MKKKIKNEISENDSPNEKETSNSKVKASKKNTTRKSTLNSSKSFEKVTSDNSDDDALLREIVSCAVDRLRSPNSKTSGIEESKDIGSKENLVKKYSTFNAEDITSDDEVYTFYCPDSFKKQDLCNKTVESLESVTDNQKGENFKLEFLDSDKKFLTIALPTEKKGGCLMNLPYKGHIVLQKSIKFTTNDFDKSENISKIKFPDNLKQRHPLLGTEWESHLNLAEKAISNFKLLNKKNKKKKEKTRKSTEKNETLDLKISPSKKKKKS